MSVFHIIAHTHWDREWHKTYQENRVRLIPFMDDVVKQINDKEDFVFTLDGQTSLIEDYLEVKPENKDMLRNAVQTKRLIPGPWYVQPDTFLPSFESLVRNLLISKRIAEPFGEQLNVGYLPDSFGQSTVVPALLKGFGMEHALIYRGVDDEDTPYNEFNWKGIDGSEVLTTWMPKGYGNGMFLSSELDKSKEVIKENIELLDKRSVSDNLLLMSGSDQCFAKSHLTTAKDQLNAAYDDHIFKLTSIDAYMKSLDPYRDKVKSLKGELRKGKHSRVHASIAGTRVDIKQANHDIERVYESLLEPLNALLYLDTKTSNRDIIQKGWKYIVENHAHDSICTVCTDTVHKEMGMRIEYASQIASTLIDTHFDRLHNLVKYDAHAGRPVLVFNGTLASGETMVDTTLYTKEKTFMLETKNGTTLDYDILEQSRMNLKDTKVSLSPLPDDFYYKTKVRTTVNVDGIGYHTLYIKEGVEFEKPERSMVGKNILENEHIHLEVKSNGLVDITDKKTGITYDDQLLFADGGNAGDEYDYSPPVEDVVITSEDCLKSVRVKKDTPLEGILELEHELQIPKTTMLEFRSDDYEPLKVVTEISLGKNADHPIFKTTVHNHLKNHRLQVLFRASEKLDNHVSDSQLGMMERENLFKDTDKSMKEGWSERYYPVFSQHRYSGFKDAVKPFMVLNRGIPQYEIKQDDVSILAVTLLSAVGMMGNKNLPYRPGRRSGAVCETPDAQMQGTHVFEYAFLPLREETRLENAATLYTHPPLVRSYAEYERDGSWPDHFSMYQSKALSSRILKVSETGDSHVLRTLNPYRESQEEAILTFNRHLFNAVRPVDLKEDDVNDPSLSIGTLNTADESDKPRLNGTITWETYTHNAARTLRFDPK